MSDKPDIIYTTVDEAPELASASFLPIIRAFAKPVGITFGTKDISLAGRILAQFPDRLPADKHQPDDLAELGELVTQWNTGIAELNAALDAALPEAVRVSFPSRVAMRIENPNDPADVGNGLINDDLEYLFIGDLSGQGEGDDVGAGGLLRASSVEGSFDAAAETTVGTINRRIALFRAATPNRGVSLTVRISAAYSGVRVGD